VLADTTAWLKVSRAPAEVRAYWTEALRTRQIFVVPVVRLELLHHERDAIAVNERDYELDQMPQLELTPEVADDAMTAMLELAARSDGYHKVPAPDYLIAATAARQDPPLAVLHHDAHYDKLAEVLNFMPYSLVPQGTAI